MRKVFVVSSDDEEACDLTTSVSSVSSVTLSGPLNTPISHRLALSDWGEPSMDTNTQPTCMPPIYNSQNIDPSKDKRKFYNVYIGELVGCYREWYVNFTVVPSNLFSSSLSIIGVTLADKLQVSQGIFTTAIQLGSLHWKVGSSIAVRFIIMDRTSFMVLLSNLNIHRAVRSLCPLEHLLAFLSLCPLDVPGTM